MDGCTRSNQNYRRCSPTAASELTRYEDRRKPQGAMGREGEENMITRLSLVTILVHDQEEALRWFTEILGLKKLQDATYGGGARWLVVAPSEQSDFGIVLQKPEPVEHGIERARMKM